MLPFKQKRNKEKKNNQLVVDVSGLFPVRVVAKSPKETSYLTSKNHEPSKHLHRQFKLNLPCDIF